MRSKRL